MLIEYVRNKNRHPIGVVVAVGKNKIGWSKCNKQDKWDRNLGIQIAKNRAEKGYRTSVPHEVKPKIDHMKKRAHKYYRKRLL